MPSNIDSPLPSRGSSGAGAPAEPIAIIGIGCRFPGGAHDAGSFWQLLRAGVDAIGEVPPDRWSAARFHDPRPAKPGKTVSRWGGFVAQRIELFDALFFGMSPREAASLDPMQRWLMEVSWEALEDAGVVPERLAGSDTAVFIGGFTEDTKILQMDSKNRDLIGPHAATGTAMTMLANRLSYLYDLRGPSVALDTACSSSLVAVHLACQSLWNGESSLALAGGVNAMFRPEYTIAESKAGMLSPDGRSKAFDARANGYVRGEGAGIVVLKPLGRALDDGDPIYAVIRGSGVNQDGRTNGITVPNGEAQQALIREVYARAGVSPAQIQYVEAHGTGTPVGDPIEANALGAALGAGRAPDDPCWIGSVKTNIGHLEAAAGIAGLIKAALSLKHGAIPPHLHLEQPNPGIDFDRLGLRVPRALEPWPRTAGPRMASVNSFGFGGTNAHVVLEAAPDAPAERRAEPAAEAQAELLPLSARSEQALLDTVRAYRDTLARGEDAPGSLGDLCHAAGVRRTHHEHRLALRAGSREALAAQLTALLSGEPVPGLSMGRRPRSPGRLVFVFGGMGPQWWAMGRELLAREPVFHEAVRACDVLLRRHAGWSLLDEMLADEARSRMAETQIAQPASFALQVGLASLWRSWGVAPDAIVGHSAGEAAAAYCAGVFSLEEAVEIIYHRSRLQHRTTGQGKLVALGVPLEEARAALAGHEDLISIAAVNSPSAVTLVGEKAALEAFVRPFEAQKAFVRFLQVDVPYHSHYMDPLRGELLEALSHLRPRRAEVPLYSTVTGARAQGTEWDAAYWWRNVREPVLFAAAAEALLHDGHGTFLEIGAHPVLGASIQECAALSGQGAVVLASLRRKAEERATLLDALGALYVAGFPVDWRGVHPRGGRPVRLPLYPWQREAHWIESDSSRRDRLGAPAHPLLGERLPSFQPTWENVIDVDRLPYLNDHVVQGTVVYPGAGYIEMMLSAARELFDAGDQDVELSDIEFRKALFLRSDTLRSDTGLHAGTETDSGADPRPRVQLVCDGEQGRATVASRAGGEGQPWTEHASATVRLAPRARRAGQISLDAWRAEHPRETPQHDCYRYLKSLGLHYGPRFQGVVALWRGASSAVARVSLHDEDRAAPGGYTLHPALLDACFQVLLATTMPPDGAGDRGPGVYLPTHIESLRLHGPVPERLWVRSRIAAFDEHLMRGDLVACDDDGNVVLELRGAVARSLEHAQGASAVDVRSLFYGVQWEPEPEPEAAAPAPASAPRAPGSWLILADRQGFGRALAARLEAQGDTCVLAFAGERFAADEARRELAVDPASLDDMRRLVDAVFGGPRQPWRGILHLFGLDAAPADDMTLDDLDSAQARGPIALLHLIQALDQSGHGDLPRVFAVTRGVHAVTPDLPPTAVAESTIWGLLRVVAYQEHADRYGGLVDLDPSRPQGELDLVAADLVAGRWTDQVAYRRGQRYVPRLVERPDLVKAAPALTFRPDGSYLITGGLGALGLLVARWMVERGARRLILLGRSAVPPRAAWPSVAADTPAGQRIAAVRGLEALGASVQLAAIDVADEAQLAAFLEQRRSEGHPPIRGVIHAAGVSRPHLMADLSKEEYAETARPKAHGAWLLHRHLAAEPLDFFVLFSSLAALGFTAGQADYAAANAFLDGLAHHRRARGLPAISINWGPWGEAGMATLLEDYFHDRGLTLFSPDLGLEALGHVLRQDVDQSTVVWIPDPQRFADRNFSSGSTVPFITRLLGGRAAGEAEGAAGAPSEDLLHAIFEPADPAEQRERLAGHLTALVARVLRLAAPQIDRHTSLGGLGLDSLLALELKNRIGTELRATVSVVDLLKGASVAELADKLHRTLAEPASPAGAAPDAGDASALVTGDVPLGPNQRWFVSRDLPNPHHWNLSTLWEVLQPIEPERLSQALEAVMLHHDALRTRFERDGRGWRQTIAPPGGAAPVTVVDLSAQSEEAQDAAMDAKAAEFQAKLDLFAGPLVQLVYYDLGARRRDRLLLILHHLVSDFVSVRIVLADLQLAYRQLAQGQPAALPPKTTSYKAWAERLVEQTRAIDQQREAAYWASQPWDAAPPLPIDHPGGRQSNTIASTRIFSTSLSAEETSALLHDVPRAQRTHIMAALLSALGEAFARSAGVDALLLDVIMHGRDALSEEMDLARTVGLFAHGIPLLLRRQGAATATEALRRVQGQLDRFLSHGPAYAPSRWLTEDSELARALRALPRRELIFNYVGQLEPSLSGGALLAAVPMVPRAMEDPRNTRDFLLQVQVGVFGGRLAALWNYSDNVHRRGTIEQLNGWFLEALRSLIRESAAPESAGAPGRRASARASAMTILQEGGE
ncbi:beta-ketoacyl synthase N-terminal-like domain-containing protein [Sorangium sp. So ce131]|uniref:beta-ketoacyl synthase N-terminal-like domain-containing protein n=1 Tax=Sorangium sp. So ce131 TaxID=3133282 RepID=UPI003F5F6BB9